MTQAEYARHRGCSREAVRRAIETGRIRTFGDDKRIDPELADTHWARNTRARVRMDQPEQKRPVIVANEVHQEKPEIYDEARTRREIAEANLAEIKEAELRGEVIRVGAVKSALASIFSSTRDSLMQIPARLSPVLAAESDAARIHDAIQLELHQCLSQLAMAGERIGRQA